MATVKQRESSEQEQMANVSFRAVSKPQSKGPGFQRRSRRDRGFRGGADSFAELRLFLELSSSWKRLRSTAKTEAVELHNQKSEGVAKESSALRGICRRVRTGVYAEKKSQRVVGQPNKGMLIELSDYISMSEKF